MVDDQFVIVTPQWLSSIQSEFMGDEKEVGYTFNPENILLLSGLLSALSKLYYFEVLGM